MQLYMTRHGCVQPIRPNDVEPDDMPVIVIPADQWRRLVVGIVILKDCGANFFASARKDAVADIEAIIASVDGGE